MLPLTKTNRISPNNIHCAGSTEAKSFMKSQTNLIHCYNTQPCTFWRLYSMGIVRREHLQICLFYHTHNKYTHYWWWVGRMRRKKTTNQDAKEKRRVSIFDLKEESEEECLTERGREFQITGLMYWKDLSPRALLPIHPASTLTLTKVRPESNLSHQVKSMVKMWFIVHVTYRVHINR